MAGTKIFVRFSQASALEHVRFRQVLLYLLSKPQSGRFLIREGVIAFFHHLQVVHM